MIDYRIPDYVNKAEVRVSSVDGKLLETISLLEMGEGQLRLRVTDYPAGTYFYSLILDGAIFETKQMVFAK